MSRECRGGVVVVGLVAWRRPSRKTSHRLSAELDGQRCRHALRLARHGGAEAGQRRTEVPVAVGWGSSGVGWG